jgi:putative ABC transport system permease protein
MRRFALRVLNLVRRDRGERELAREVDAHLALLEEEHVRRGVTPDQARAAARRAMGSVALANDLHRDARSFVWIDDMRHDLRFAARMLVRNPGFAAVVIFTMAVSIGATTTLFSLAYGVLMRPLPWSQPDRLVRLQETRGSRVARIPWTISNAAYLAWREQASSTVEEVGGWFRSRPVTVDYGDESERLTIGAVTPSLFRVLRAQPEIGRLFIDADAPDQQSRVLMLGYGLWQRRFGGRTDVIGALIRVDGQPYTIVGVMPRGFTFPTADTQAWTAYRVPTVNGQGGVIRLTLF